MASGFLRLLLLSEAAKPAAKELIENVEAALLLLRLLLL